MSKTTGFFKKKRNIVLVILTAVLLIAAAVCAVVFLGGKYQPEDNAELINPIEEGVIYVDKFPETVDEAYALVSQKAYLARMEDQYQVDSSFSANVENLQANSTDKVRSAVKSGVKDAVKAVNDLFPAVHLNFGEKTDGVLPGLSVLEQPDSFSADCTKEGVFRITLEYKKEDASLLLPEYNALIENTLNAALNASLLTDGVLLRETGASVYAEIDGQHGTLLLLEIKKTYHVNFTQKEDVITFSLAGTTRYEIVREGIFFVNRALTMHKDQITQLPMILHLPDGLPAENCKVVFRSSDETALTVTNDGTVTALVPTEESVLVTVMLTINGDARIFSDVCEIIVTQ